MYAYCFWVDSRELYVRLYIHHYQCDIYFALITPNVYSLIYDRLLDTVIGVGLSFAGNYLILPTWEHNTYREAVTKSVKANIGYLQRVKEIF